MKRVLACLTVLLVVVGAAGCSSTEPSRETDPRDPMQGLGYLSGYEEPPERTGVTVHEDTAYDGLNLWVSGHKPAAYLMDMDGNVVHTWEKSWEEAFPEVELRPAAKNMLMTGHWRKVHPTRRGELFIIFEHSGFLKLDRDSRLLWSHFHNQHHDLDVDESGTVYTLAKSYEEVELFGETKKRLNGYIRVYDPEGNLLEEHDILEAFRRSPYRAVLGNMKSGERELLHANSIRVLDDGRFLLSFRKLNAIAWLNPDTDRVERVMQDHFSQQHDAHILGNDNLLLFDNSNFMRSSRALEMDLDGETVVWSYGQREGERFYSACCGTAQRLPNGNTLITDSDSGKAFEVTPRGTVVWEYVNPHVTSGDRIATLFEMQRLPRDYFKTICSTARCQAPTRHRGSGGTRNRNR